MSRAYLVIAFILLSAAPSWADGFLIYSAQKTIRAPIIDGVLSDPCWKDAEKTSPFIAIGGKQVPFQTQAMLAYDRKNLYLAFICAEPLLNTLKERKAKGMVSPFEESVEIFIDTNHSHFTYFQFRVGISEERDSRREMEVDADLNTKWLARVSFDEKKWYVEAVIPFACLEKAPSSGALWGLNLNRNRSVEPEGGWTCWSDTKGGFHSPGRFGHLIFADYSGWLKAYFEKRINNLSQEINSLLGEYPATASLKNKVNSLKEENLKFFRKVTAGKIDTGDKCVPFYTEGESLVMSYEEILSELQLTIIRNHFKK